MSNASVALETVKELRFALTDSGNAERFAAQHRHRARYVPQLRQWLVFDGKRWEPDARGAVDLLAKQTVRSMDAEVSRETDDDARKKLRTHATKSESRQGRENMIALARSEVAASAEDFDRDPFAFNVRNGTLDLQTGELQPHDASDMITKIVDVDFDRAATCPVFEAFIGRALAGRADLVSYVQKAIGYSLTGSVEEQAFFFCHGEGSNGKSTLSDVLLSLLGPYAKAGAPDLLVAREHDQHPAEQADLQGSRLVICQEIAEGKSWNERTLKHLTGGDRIKARRMHQDWIEFAPTHKLWVLANPKPKMREGGVATWRRVRLVPFDVIIPPEERDRRLGAKLLAELPGIPLWAVRGCLLWQLEGLVPPAEVATATNEYEAESDHVATFVEDRLHLDAAHQVSKATLFENYTLWCKHNRETPLSRNEVHKRLVARGLVDTRTTASRMWRGASLRSFSGTRSRVSPCVPCRTV